MCYIHSTYNLRLTGWVGDEAKEIAPHLFADADFAGDCKTSKSIFGLQLMLLGPNTYYPITGQSKKQGCQSHSTSEAEIVAAEHALRTVGLPALTCGTNCLVGKPFSIFTRITSRPYLPCAPGTPP